MCKFIELLERLVVAQETIAANCDALNILEERRVKKAQSQAKWRAGKVVESTQVVTEKKEEENREERTKEEIKRRDKKKR